MPKDDSIHRQLANRTQSWQLTDVAPLCETATSHVFRCKRQGEDLALKILTEAGFRDERRGANALRHFDGAGAARLIEATDRAHLLEFVDGPDMKSLNDEDAAIQFCDVVKQLHREADPATEFDLIPLDTRFASLLNAPPEILGSSNASLIKEAATLAEALLKAQEGIVPLHGDLHHENILLHPERGWLAIDPKGLIGDPVFDLANWFYNPTGAEIEHLASDGRISMLTKTFSERLKKPAKKILNYAYAYGVLSAIWSLEDGHSYDATLTIAKAIKKVQTERADR